MGTIHVHRELKYKSPIINKVVRNLSVYMQYGSMSCIV